MTVYGYTDPVPLILAFNVDIVTGRIAIEKTKSPDAASDETLPEEGEKFSKYSRPKPSINQQREPSGRTAERLSPFRVPRLSRVKRFALYSES